MKFMASALVVVVLAAAGCQDSKSSPSMTPSNGSVTDVAFSPTPVATVTPASYDAPGAQPATPAIQSSPTLATPAGSTYTIKSGDTLWKIAASHYGNGNQWKKIADANPGLTPSTLKVGQTITIP